MKIYLDIDETILNNSIMEKTIHGWVLASKPAPHLKEFLEYMLKNHDVYWLTTHCNGDATTAVSWMNKYVSQDITDLIMRIKPTSWKHFKAEAINMDEDFLWFDDTLSFSDEELLKSKNKLSSYVKVDLDSNPDVLLEYIDRKPACKAYVIDIFKKSYMLHIWTWPKLSLGWHRKLDGPNNKILGIRKY